MITKSQFGLPLRQKAYKAFELESTVQEFRVFECGHNFHKACVDNAFEIEQESDSDSGELDFFDLKKEKQLSLYQSYKKQKEKEKKIRCLVCRNFSLETADMPKSVPTLGSRWNSLSNSIIKWTFSL